MNTDSSSSSSCFSSTRTFKHALAWRASGGVACYVKDAIASRFELWRVSSPGSILWLRSKEKFTWVSGDFHLHIGLVYIPPRGASSEKQNTVSSYEVLQQDLADVLAGNGLMAHFGFICCFPSAISCISSVSVERAVPSFST